MTRQPWGEYFLDVADAVRTRAACTRDRVGAVLVNGRNRIVSTGYNGVPSGWVHCSDGGCPRGRLGVDVRPRGGSYDDCVAVHAEVNAVREARAERPGVVLSGLTLFVSRQPCDDCQGMLDELGIGVRFRGDGK